MTSLLCSLCFFRKSNIIDNSEGMEEMSSSKAITIAPLPDCMYVWLQNILTRVKYLLPEHDQALILFPKSDAKVTVKQTLWTLWEWVEQWWVIMAITVVAICILGQQIPAKYLAPPVTSFLFYRPVPLPSPHPIQTLFLTANPVQVKQWFTVWCSPNPRDPICVLGTIVCFLSLTSQDLPAPGRP